MATKLGLFCALACVASALATVVACTNSSSSGGSGGDAGTGSGSYTYSCTQGTDLCTQTTGPDSAQSGEQKACSMVSGTFAVGPCATAGSLGCCVDVTGVEMQCAYSPQEAPVLQQLCNRGKTWIPAEGGVAGEAGAAAEAGVTGAAAFVGTWLRAGMQTVTCPANTTMSTITGEVVVALGSTSNTIVVTQPDGCMMTYSVSGNVATATPGQSCNITTEAGIAETITVTSHTFTLSADGQTLMSQGSDTIDKTATGIMCTGMSSGTFTKQ